MCKLVDKRISIEKASCGYRNARLLPSTFSTRHLGEMVENRNLDFAQAPFIEPLGFCSNKLIRMAVLQRGKRVFHMQPT